jgi:hypothetical protein
MKRPIGKSFRAHGARGAPPGSPLQFRYAIVVIAASEPQSPRPGYLRERSPQNFRCYPLRVAVTRTSLRLHRAGKLYGTSLLPPAKQFIA